MQPIATDFTEGNYRFTQVERRGDFAIYQQQHRQAPGVIRYEVVKIRVQPEHTWPDGRTSPEREVYPSSSSWGTLGYTVYRIEEAQSLLAEWEQRDAD